MFSLVTVNSTTDGDVSNFTESLTNGTQHAVSTSESEEIEAVLRLVIIPVLIVFGTIGNGLSFYIMRQGSMKKMSTCFYLSILALADTSKYGVFLFICLVIVHTSKCGVFLFIALAIVHTCKCGLFLFICLAIVHTSKCGIASAHK